MDTIDLSALTTGAAITSLLGLSGFIVACIYLMYLRRTKLERQKLQLLPRDARGPYLDDLLTRYKVTAENASEESKVNLILHEMNLRFRTQIGLAVLGAIVFLTCFIIVAFRPAPVPLVNEKGERVRTEADELVISYQNEILGPVRAEFEARRVNPGASNFVRKEGKRLANLLDGIRDAKLNTVRRISKDEYSGWALLMVSRTFAGPSEESRRERIRYAEDAIERFDSAIAKMENVKRDYSEGDKFAAEDYNYIMDIELGNWHRTHYLKALAFAVIGEAGGGATKDQVQAELEKVDDAYEALYPPSNIDEFKWAM